MISDPLISTLFPSIISDGHSAAMFLLCWAFHYRAEAGPAIAPWDREQTFTSTAATAGSGASDTSTTHQKAACSTPDTPPAAEPAELPPPGPLSSDNHLLLPPRFYTGGGKGTAQQQQQKAVDPGCSSRPVTRLRCLDAAACHTTTLPGCRSRPVTRLRCLQLQEVGGEGWKCCLREGLALSRAMRKEAQRYPGLLSKTGTSVQVVHLPPPQVLQLKVSVGQERPPPCHYNRHV